MPRTTRKIQKVGGSTYSVSLPKDWARARDLEAGSLVTLYAHPDDVLVVQPGEDGETTERTIRVEHDDPDRLAAVLGAAYTSGLDTLEIEAAEALSRPQRRAVGRAVETLPGAAVVEELTDRMTVRVLLDGDEVSIEQSVRQLAYVATSMHREALAALTGGSSSESVDRDGEAARLFALVDRHVQRVLSRVETVDAVDTARPALAELRATARELEAVATDARRLASFAGEVEDVGDLDASGERTCEILETATDAVVTDAGVDAARAAIDDERTLAAELDAIERELLSAGDGGLRLRATAHCRRTAGRGATIARLAIRGGLRRDDLALDAAEPGPATGWIEEPPADDGSASPGAATDPDD